MTYQAPGVINCERKDSSGVLVTSIQGIQKEIERREVLLRQRKMWFMEPVKSGIRMNFHGFYDGYRIMKEIQKLKAIQYDLITLVGLASV